jgi:4-hydroxy-tetrahydrodipicolinate synthase
VASLTPRAGLLAGRLRRSVIPAVLSPMGTSGRLDVSALEHYAELIVSQPVGGVAVWAHTGRGPHLEADDRRAVLRAFRTCTDKPVIAGIGQAARDARTEPAPRTGAAGARSVDALLARAEEAAEGGADALMVFPPAIAGPPARREAEVLGLHARLASRVGLPMVLFVLHEAAGGYPYSPALLRELLSMPEVVGVKVATLDSAMTCQDITSLVHREFPDRLAITGEDRMLGPSLMWGADAALVGIAGAAGQITTRLLEAWYGSPSHEGFLDASERLDKLALATFIQPIEGYVQRMLWVAEAEGSIPGRAAYDPFGPPLPTTEREVVLEVVRALGLGLGTMETPRTGG